MGQDLQWAGAWRKLGPDDSMGQVTGVRVAMGSARPGIESVQMEAPRKEPETRPNGRVRLPPV